jgi:hypothetical protein
MSAVDCDFAHVLGGGERARLGTAREIFAPARRLRGRAFDHPTQ